MVSLKKCVALAMATTALVGTGGFTVFADDDDEMFAAVDAAVTGFIISHPVVHRAVEYVANHPAEDVVNLVDTAVELGKAVAGGAKKLWDAAVEGEAMKDPYNPSFID